MSIIRGRAVPESIQRDLEDNVNELKFRVGRNDSNPFKPPLFTTAQRDAIGSPEEGDLIFNTDAGELQVFIGGVWTSVGKEVPQAIGNLELFLRADQGIAFNGSDVASWTSIVNSIVASQGSSTNQPPYTAENAAYNNQPTVGFTIANSEYLSGVAAALNGLYEQGLQDWTYYIVGNTVADTNSKAALSFADTAGGNNWWYMGYSPTEEHRLAQFDGTYREVVSATGALTSPHWAAGTFDASLDDGKVFVNGVNDGLNANMIETPTGIDTFGIGARVTSSVAVFFGGSIAEIGVYSKILSSSELTELGTYISERYNI